MVVSRWARAAVSRALSTVWVSLVFTASAPWNAAPASPCAAHPHKSHAVRTARNQRAAEPNALAAAASAVVMAAVAAGGGSSSGCDARACVILYEHFGFPFYPWLVVLHPIDPRNAVDL